MKKKPAANFNELRFFKRHEFDSPDLVGSGALMDQRFLALLDQARQIADTPFRINSGYRSPVHNQRVGGSTNSSHIRGHGADIACTDNFLRHKIVHALIAVGFTRIGIARTFIHADNDPSLPQGVMWLYS
jgi:zinc D-Ala-D-Ala carboxypeptidase